MKHQDTYLRLDQPQLEHQFPHLTQHARRRMQGRHLSPTAIDTVLEFGRRVHTRGAVIHAIGRKEIARYRGQGIDLSELDGVQVVCSREGTVLTIYRNRNFRWLRSGLGRGRYHPAWEPERLTG